MYYINLLGLPKQNITEWSSFNSSDFFVVVLFPIVFVLLVFFPMQTMKEVSLHPSFFALQKMAALILPPHISFVAMPLLSLYLSCFFL